MTDTDNADSKQLAANRLAAGRILATESHPYLSKTLFAMVPVPTEGLGTFAVDKRWRMYYDPEVCLQWSTKEIAAVWLHEAGHLIRDHAQRFENFSESQYAEEWNHAADAAINSDLKDEGILLPLPDRRFYAEPNEMYPSWQRGMTTEEMFKEAIGGNGQEEEKNGSGKPEDESVDSSDASDPSDSGNPNSTSPDESSDADSESQNEENKDDSSEQGGNQDVEAGQDDADAGNNASASPNGSPDEQNAPSGVVDCGSGATGGKRDYEVPDDADDGSLNPDEAEMVRQETAHEIMDHAQRGNVPAGMVREAEDILDPQVDWRVELMSIVRRVCATVAGAKDYSYQRPSRRSRMTSFYLPSMRAPRPPEIFVVLDTSGSMTAADLAIALSELQSIVERSSSGSARGSIKVVSCDADAKETEIVKSIDDVSLVGGGGTDMRIGIKRASEMRPKPDAIITITDGGTQWPEEPYALNISHINVIIQTDTGSNRKYQWSSQPPDWMHTIYVKRHPSRITI